MPKCITLNLKGLVLSKMFNLSLITHPYVVPKPLIIFQRQIKVFLIKSQSFLDSPQTATQLTRSRPRGLSISLKKVNLRSVVLLRITTLFNYFFSSVSDFRTWLFTRMRRGTVMNACRVLTRKRIIEQFFFSMSTKKVFS